jgi:low affinity Fe/Cu permease
MHDHFRRFAASAANIVGSAWAFLVAAVLILIWAGYGLLFGWRDSHLWLLNTVIAITTLLMVFILQNSQNRDTRAIQLKLDELIRAVEGARTHMVSLEGMSDEELAELREEFSELRHQPNTDGAGELLEDDIESIDEERQERQEERQS